MALPANRPLSEAALTVDMTDVSAATSVWIASPFRGRIVRIYAILSAAITSADSAVTVEINGTAISGLSLTLANSGSAAGSVFSATVSNTSTAYVNEGDAIEVISDGNSSTTSRGTFTVVIERD